MVGMVEQDCGGPVKLLSKKTAHEKVREGEAAKRNCKVGSAENRSWQSLRAPDEKGRCRVALGAEAEQLRREGLAREGLTFPVESDKTCPFRRALEKLARVTDLDKLKRAKAQLLGQGRQPRGEVFVKVALRTCVPAAHRKNNEAQIARLGLSLRHQRFGLEAGRP